MRRQNAVRLAAAIGVLALSGCDTGMFDFGPVLFGTSSNLSELNDAQAAGTPFQRAQFKDYAYLARSFGNDPSGDAAELADAYAGKALAATKGDDVMPETARTSQQQDMRARLVRALAQGRAQVPDDAARAQADYDCWVLNDSIPESARRCKSSLDATLPQLEMDAGLPSF